MLPSLRGHDSLDQVSNLRYADVSICRQWGHVNVYFKGPLGWSLLLPVFVCAYICCCTI